MSQNLLSAAVVIGTLRVKGEVLSTDAVTFQVTYISYSRLLPSHPEFML